jgi:uncharacterized membrane protein SpoIIM required for sporulation
VKVADLLETRRDTWRELENLCVRTSRGIDRLDPQSVQRFASLYRSACADLALADASQLPPGTIEYLHRLVGRAHNQLYRAHGFRLGDWGRMLLVEVPQRLFADRYLRLALCLFWGVFLLCGVLAYARPEFAAELVGKESLTQLDEMYSHSPEEHGANGMMAGFYVQHNVGIGLQCFALGLAFGVLGLFVTLENAAFLGAMFGWMAQAHLPQRENFFHFVTAHGPFELTAIVLMAACGMRLGFALVDTGGLTRHDSLRQAGRQAMPLVGVAIVLFVLAAMIEGFLSPSAAPYELKAAVAIGSTLAMVFYYLLGWPRRT